jgi:hypothetical protein
MMAFSEALVRVCPGISGCGALKREILRQVAVITATYLAQDTGSCPEISISG